MNLEEGLRDTQTRPCGGKKIPNVAKGAHYLLMRKMGLFLTIRGLPDTWRQSGMRM